MHADHEKPSHIEDSKQRTFILRCWTTAEGQTRLRLIDDQLNELVSSLTESEKNEEVSP
jgi:hypothetical protein